MKIVNGPTNKQGNDLDLTIAEKNAILTIDHSLRTLELYFVKAKLQTQPASNQSLLEKSCYTGKKYCDGVSLCTLEHLDY